MRPNNGIVPPRSLCTVVGNVLLLLDQQSSRNSSVLEPFLLSTLVENFGVLYAFCAPAVTMQAQTVVPPDLQCKDKFMVQSVVISDSLSAKDITSQMVVILCIFPFGLWLSVWY